MWAPWLTAAVCAGWPLSLDLAMSAVAARACKPWFLTLLAALSLPAAAAAAGVSVGVRVTDAAGKALPDAVVFLESSAARAAVKPAAAVEVAQVNKSFVPTVTVVPVGTAVNFPNRDTVRHHVYSFSPTKRFEIKLYVGTPASPVVFDQAGIAVLGCNIHDNMAAWVVVVETPHFARTGADGLARLQGVPPGQYRLRSWHPALPVGAPAQDEVLDVGAGMPPKEVRLKDARP